MIKHWLSAARPRTLPLAFSSILMGSSLSLLQKTSFSWVVFGLTLLTTTLLQILSNFANDLGDYQNGADLAGRVGPARAVQSGDITYKQMLNAIILLSILSLASGIGLLLVAFGSFTNPHFYQFLLVGLACILAAITYTAGKKPYGYAGLGDISVFIFFGLVGVLGTSFLQLKTLEMFQILPAISVGFLAVAVLNINNLRDIESDTRAGKKTIPVRFGKAFGVKYHQILLVLSFIAITLFNVNHIKLSIMPVGLFAINVWPILKGIKIDSSPEYIDSFLKKTAMVSFFNSITIFLFIVLK